jgi:hypothetical protein
MSQPQQSRNNDSRDLDELIQLKDVLLNKFRWLDRKIQLLSDEQSSEERIERLLNSQRRLAKSIVEIISLLRNPRLNISEDDNEEDLAQVISAVKARKHLLPPMDS